MISIITDTFAFVGGKFIGKHKLIEVVSPKKTIEGMIVGTLMGTFIGSTFYLTVINSSNNVYLVILVTMFLSILGQFGDLAFSAIKRYFGKKDFSNIMPGHGGVLDRLDSIIFIMLAYLFVSSLI
jgi:phosphatidate cytidylyltransferase